MMSTNSRLVVRVLGSPCSNCYNVKMTEKMIVMKQLTGTTRRAGKRSVLLGLALLLSGCGSTNLLNSSALDLFSTSTKATTADAGTGAESNTDIECPGIEVRTGAATLMIGSKPGQGEPSALDLRYQATIVRTARECHVNAGVMTMKVGIEGRVITGPAGGPGSLDVPIRIAVVQEGVNPKTVASKFASEQVAVASAV